MTCRRPHLSNEEYIVMALQQNRGTWMTPDEIAKTRPKLLYSRSVSQHMVTIRRHHPEIEVRNGRRTQEFRVGGDA